MSEKETFDKLQAATSMKLAVPEKRQASLNWLKLQYLENCRAYIAWDNQYPDVPFHQGTIHSMSDLIDWLELNDNMNCAVVQADNFTAYMRYYEPGNDCDLFSFMLIKQNNLQYANIPEIPGEGK